MIASSILLSAASDAARLQLNTLMLLVAAMLVLVMVVGASYFYGSFLGSNGGQTSTRAALGTVALVLVLWVVYGYGLAFGPALLPGFLGNPIASVGRLFGESSSISYQLAFAAFQAAVTVLTVTLVGGAVAGRARLRAWLVFTAIWVTVVYLPLAYAVFNVNDGWIFNVLQVNDQAGGTVVQIGAGAAALALLIVFRRKRASPVPRRGIPLTLVGVALLWVGWFGLNVGSEGVVDGLFATLVTNTLLAPVGGIVAWVLVELLRGGRPTVRGAASGTIAGLVAITPACNILTPNWAILLGVIAGAVCALAVSLKSRFRLGDGFDLVGIHLVGGVLGMLYIGLFGTGIGWRDNGQPERFIAQAEAAIGVALYVFVLTFVIAWVIEKTMGFAAIDSRSGS